MVATLPRHIRLKLDQTLAQWRHWQCEPPLRAAPGIDCVLGRGHSNFNVLVGSGGRFVVRIDGIDPAGHGLSRQAEWRALQVAAAAGLAPQPRYFNPDLGSLVCDYLPPDTGVEPGLADIAALLQAIHRLPARHHRLDLGERIRRYEKRLQHLGRPPQGPLAACRTRVRSILEGLDDPAQPMVLCHNDLLRANRIHSGGRLCAIDWEYCAMGSPWYDLAVVAAGDGLDPAAQDGLLEAYLGGPAEAHQRAMFHGYGCVYRYLELLWYHCLARPALGSDEMRGKLAALESALLSP